MVQRLPVEPFLAAVRASHDELGRDVPRATRKAIERARAAGTVSELVADRLGRPFARCAPRVDLAGVVGDRADRLTEGRLSVSRRPEVEGGVFA